MTTIAYQDLKSDNGLLTPKRVTDTLKDNGCRAIYVHGPSPEKVCKIEKLDAGGWQVNFPHQIFGAGKNVMVFEDGAKYVWLRDGERALNGIFDAVSAVNVFFNSRPVEVGDEYVATINQGVRECWVTKIAKTRYREEHTMPNVHYQGAWRKGVLICGKLYY